jgi:hypothetical protein
MTTYNGGVIRVDEEELRLMRFTMDHKFEDWAAHPLAQELPDLRELELDDDVGLSEAATYSNGARVELLVRGPSEESEGAYAMVELYLPFEGQRLHGSLLFVTDAPLDDLEDGAHGFIGHGDDLYEFTITTASEEVAVEAEKVEEPRAWSIHEPVTLADVRSIEAIGTEYRGPANAIGEIGRALEHINQHGRSVLPADPEEGLGILLRMLKVYMDRVHTPLAPLLEPDDEMSSHMLGQLIVAMPRYQVLSKNLLKMTVPNYVDQLRSKEVPDVRTFVQLLIGTMPGDEVAQTLAMLYASLDIYGSGVKLDEAWVTFVAQEELAIITGAEERMAEDAADLAYMAAVEGEEVIPWEEAFPEDADGWQAHNRSTSRAGIEGDE